MADRMPAEIQIGGKIRRSVAEALCSVVADAGGSLDWGEAQFQPETTDDLLSARSDDEGPHILKLYDDQARWGEFATLETFLREQGIPYRRYTDGKFDYDPEIEAFHPDCGLVEWFTDHNRHPVVQASELATIADRLAAVLAAMEHSKSQDVAARRDLRRIHDAIRQDLLPNLPALESFEIIDA